jgi:hypothetical protein
MDATNPVRWAGSRGRDPLPAPATEGLSALDRDRAGTLADEGGVTAAALEARPSTEDGEGEGRRSSRTWRRAALLAGATLAVLAAWTSLRPRAR